MKTQGEELKHINNWVTARNYERMKRDHSVLYCQEGQVMNNSIGNT